MHLIFLSDQREDNGKINQRLKVYTPRSGLPTRSGAVRQDARNNILAAS
jgi:hypothetical protein